MPNWFEKKTYYYGALNEDSDIPVKWKMAPTLYDAIMGAKSLVSKSDVGEVEIQTRPINPPIGVRIPSYRIGCVTKFKSYVYSHYTARSFNARTYCKDYMIKGKNIVEAKR